MGHQGKTAQGKMSPQVKVALIGAAALIVATLIPLLFKTGTTTRQETPGTANADSTTSRPRPAFPMPLESQFFPSGWMGDGKSGKQYLSLEHITADVNGKAQAVLRIDYRRGPEGWAGIYWQHPDGNWGDRPGIDLTGAREITFFARGENGGEIVEFKSGGIRGAHADSFERSLGKQTLSKNWKLYQIDLGSANLTSVIGAVAWSAPAAPSGRLTFYLSDMQIR